MDEELTPDYKTALKNLLDSIKESGDINETALGLWFEGVSIKSITREKTVFAVPTEFNCSTLKERYLKIIEKHLSIVLGYEATAQLIVDSSDYVEPTLEGEGYVLSPLDIAKINIDRVSKGKERITFADYDPSMRITDTEEPTFVSTEQKNPAINVDYTFENFVVGGSNSLAVAAAKAVADQPAQRYNPFFIYGPSGVGKTHLMYAITNRVLEKYPKKKIAYVKGEEFANQLIESIANRKTAAQFRERYRGVDMLLIDDVHFIAGREATQEEFFHTFNTLYEQHKQIVVTSDRPPKDMPTLESRLRSRFESGLLADIQSPDFDLRLAIMRKKAEQYNISLGLDVEMFLAQSVHSNVRQIEGVIKKLSAVYFLTGEIPTVATIKEFIPEFLQEDESAEVIAEKVIKVTAEHFGVTPEDITGGKRDKNIKNARNAAMYVIHKMTDMSLKNIGLLFGARTHSTVYSNCVAAESSAEADKQFAAELKAIERECRG